MTLRATIGTLAIGCLFVGTMPAYAHHVAGHPEGITFGQSSGGSLSQIIPNLFGVAGITNFKVVQLGCCPQGHLPHFQVASDRELTSLNDALRGQLANIPLPSPASGFTFQLDPALGTFVRTTEGFGPIYAERAETIGRRRLAIGFGYSHFDFTQLDGRELDNGEVALTFLHEPTAALNAAKGLPNNAGRPFGFEQDTVTARIFADVDADVFLFTATYGLLDNLDLSLAIPIIRISMDVRGVATSNNQSRTAGGAPVPGTFAHTFANGQNTFETGQVSEESTGLGDIILRAKYNFYRQKPMALAGGLDLRLPTGDEDELRGVGSVRVRPFFILSAGSWYGISPHVNLGFDLGDSDAVDNEFFYRVGFDWAVLKPLTLAFDILGRYVIDNNRLQPDGQPAGDHIVDASIGLKFNPWRNLLILANVLVPINDTGLRASFVPYVGVEWTF
ncbi:MAG: transporter [Candidatus Rokuibacteriota bacterium]